MAVISLPRFIIRIRQRWLMMALLAVFIAVSVQYTAKTSDGKRSALIRWIPAFLEFEAGQNIYDKYLHPNSPTMVLILLPFAHMPPLVAGLTWFYLKAGVTLLALHWVFRLVESPGQPFPPWAKALAVLLSLDPVLGDLSHGNVNLFILFLLIAALYVLHRGWEGWAGVLLALAIDCKVTPALFVPYLIWKRRWKTLAGCAIGVPVFLWVMPALVLGFEKNAEFVGSWLHAMIRPFLVEGRVFYSEHNNQSLPGLIARMLTRGPSFSTYQGDLYVSLEWHNLAALDPRWAAWLVKGCMGAFAMVVVWACRTPANTKQPWRLAAEYGLVVLGMLLFSERTWKHHCVTLLLPFAVLCYYLAVCRPGPRLRGYLIGSLAAAVLFMLSTSTGLWRPLDRIGELAQVYGAFVWAYLLLAAALIVLLRRKEPLESHRLENPAGVLDVAKAPFFVYKSP